jgi:chitodextrinase
LIAVAASSNQINLSWNASTDNVGVTAYWVERSLGSGGSSFTQVGTPAGTGFTDIALASSTVYNYRVRAVDAAGNVSAYSSVATATTANPPPDQTPPTAPTGLVAVAVSSNQVNLSWGASTDNVGVTGYLVERAQGTGSTTFTQMGTTAVTSLSDSGLTASTIYNYRVRATDAAGNLSSYSSVATASTTSANIPAGLVAAYGFEEGTGSSVVDASGNGNNGTIAGAVWSTAGRFGNALSFNGTNAVITVKDSASLDLTAGVTMEAWVNPTALGGWRSLLCKPLGTSGLCYVLQGSSSSGSVPSLGLSVSPANLLGTNALPLNIWSHLAATYDGVTMRLYVNGTQVATKVQSGAIATSADPLTIGGDSSGEDFAGLVDEVRVYNRALIAAEIQADMNNPVNAGAQKPPAPTGLRVVGP